jgi:methyltransferase (TIGR00027 family)
MDETGISQGDLAFTARWTAGVRALENRRPDRLFTDPWAEDLAGAQSMAWVKQREEEKVLPIVLRTRFFDDFLLKMADQEHLHQVVLLAAGLDTRAYRLGWPKGTRFFELDQASVLDHKEHVLAVAGVSSACDRRSIQIDLTAPWKGAFQASAFDPAQPSLWLLEGFLFYLPNHAITQLLDQVTDLAASGSWLGFDIATAWY